MLRLNITLAYPLSSSRMGRMGNVSLRYPNFEVSCDAPTTANRGALKKRRAAACIAVSAICVPTADNYKTQSGLIRDSFESGVERDINL